MNKFLNLWRNLTQRIDPDVLNAYRSAIPQHVNVQVEDEKNGYLITVNEINHESLPKEILLVSEAANLDDVQEMVNDLVLSYKNVPDLYRPFFKNILSLEGSTNKNTESLTLVKG